MRYWINNHQENIEISAKIEVKQGCDFEITAILDEKLLYLIWQNCDNWFFGIGNTGAKKHNLKMFNNPTGITFLRMTLPPWFQHIKMAVSESAFTFLQKFKIRTIIE